MMNILITDKDYKNFELFGSKYLIGNGYMGIRGTLEESGSEQLAACTLSGLYDLAEGSKWREPVNAPHPISVKTFWCDEKLDVFAVSPASHIQSLDVSCAAFRRETVFNTSRGEVKLESERFVSMFNAHLGAVRYSVRCQNSGRLRIETCIDTNIWDINGPHLKDIEIDTKAGILVVSARTSELGEQLSVAQGVSYKGVICRDGKYIIERDMRECETLTFQLFFSVFKASDGVGDCSAQALDLVKASVAQGYDVVLARSRERWREIWECANVVIEGDSQADLALRYSIYLLLVSAPFNSDRVAMPGRGLSGQVYKGAMFWDTEIYIMPMFLHTLPEVSKNLISYRVRTLDGARRKAAEYGYRGAFYAWESQETGDDSCTHHNINDIFTGRPLRTYFRDKQIHISADVAYAIGKYYSATLDDSFLINGAAEVLLECARFLYSYSYFKPDKDRYELLDVTGADEYHERVNNSAYTNLMTLLALELALWVLDYFDERYPGERSRLMEKLDYYDDLPAIREMARKLYVPSPDPVTGLIEQFDGYLKLEDITPSQLKARIIKENEYLGYPSGLAVETQMIKQADVVLLCALMPERYTLDQKIANWRYYEPRTEHGSSLSTCIYALSAAECGMTDWAYHYFMKAARLDLDGGYKLYVGDQYIGGTHPAANGGSWMVAVNGFAGLRVERDCVRINPKLPAHWESIKLNLFCRGSRFKVTVSQNSAQITASDDNKTAEVFKLDNTVASVNPGDCVELNSKG